MANRTSPRQGFPVNIDQLANCGGGPDAGKQLLQLGQPAPPAPCGPPAMGYRYGKYKYLESVSNDTWYPLPTTTLSPWTFGTPWDPQIQTTGVKSRLPAAVTISSVGREQQQPGPQGPVVTVMFDLAADPNESVNLLEISPLPAGVATALAAIKAELAAFLMVAVPPGNTTQDGRFADLCQKDGAVGPWCPFPTQAECIASATPGAPDGNKVPA